MRIDGERMFVSKIIIFAAFFQQIWLGSSIFLSWIMAPILFSKFGGQIAADVMGMIFPVYGWLLALCSVFCFVASFFVWQRKAHFGAKISLLGLGLAGTAFVLALIQALYVFPHSHALRLVVKAGRAAGDIDSVAAQAAEMMTLHRVSMSINTTLVLLAIFMFWHFQRVLRRLEK